jgi:ABC-type bacteriocin/lantibiotic exporter with double-glycine peptidase domain
MKKDKRALNVSEEGEFTLGNFFFIQIVSSLASNFYFDISSTGDKLMKIKLKKEKLLETKKANPFYS